MPDCRQATTYLSIIVLTRSGDGFDLLTIRKDMQQLDYVTSRLVLVISRDDAHALLVSPSLIRLDRAPSPSDELHVHSSTPYTHHPHHLLNVLLTYSRHNTKVDAPITRRMRHNNPTIYSTRLPKPLPTANFATRSFVLSPLSSCLYSIWPLAENPRRLCFARLCTVRASGKWPPGGRFSGLLRHADAARQRWTRAFATTHESRLLAKSLGGRDPLQ